MYNTSESKYLKLIINKQIIKADSIICYILLIISETIDIRKSDL